MVVRGKGARPGGDAREAAEEGCSEQPPSTVRRNVPSEPPEQHLPTWAVPTGNHRVSLIGCRRGENTNTPEMARHSVRN